MKLGNLLLTLSFLALWAPWMLLSAPVKRRCLLKCQCDEDCPVGHTCASYRGRLLCRPIAAVAGVPGTPSSIPGCNTGVPQSSGVHSKGKATSELPPPGASLKDTQLTQCYPVPKGPPERGEGTRDNLPPKEMDAFPPKKPVCKKKPHPQVSTVEAGSVEEPPVASEGMFSSGREETPAGETSRPPDCSRPATRPASTEEELLSDAGHLLRDDITSGHKPVGGSVSASNSPPSKPSGEKPAFSEDRGLNTGHAAHGKPVSSGQSASDRKPTTHPGNRTQAISTAGAKPTSQPGQGVHNEPAPKEKPESAGKPAEKPEPAKQTEEEAGNDSSTEGFEEEDEEDNEGEGREPALGAGSSEGDEEDSDAFDKELDYGLNQSPFNPYEYHDAWSEEDSDDPEAGLEDGLAEDSAGLRDGEPVFDVWGDNVNARGLGLELQLY